MLLIRCPFCGARSEFEFRYGGEAIRRPAVPSATTDEAWADFLYGRCNTAGIHRELWHHVHGCGRYFGAVRDTTTDRFIKTYALGAPNEAEDRLLL